MSQDTPFPCLNHTLTLTPGPPAISDLLAGSSKGFMEQLPKVISGGYKSHEEKQTEGWGFESVQRPLFGGIIWESP